MVNWREDVEFFYVLFMLISGIVAFFTLYESEGLLLAGVAVVIVVLVEGAIGFAVFETDRAIANWEKLGKNDPKQ
jgi:TctA family transporter